MIRFEQAALTVPSHLGPQTILQPTSLTLSEHRIALIGANGSGKSTLARMINGLTLPTSGSVSVGIPHAKLSGSTTWLNTARDGVRVRQAVGFTFTDPAAQLVMPTAIEDVSLSLRKQFPQKAARTAAAHHTLNRFGLGELAEHSVHTLSGGQKQMLALTSVLATSPQILVADEPTTLLDLRNTRLLINTLTALPQQLIVVTHDLELASMCDRVIVMAHGTVACDSAISHPRPEEVTRTSDVTSTANHAQTSSPESIRAIVAHGAAMPGNLIKPTTSAVHSAIAWYQRHA